MARPKKTPANPIFTQDLKDFITATIKECLAESVISNPLEVTAKIIRDEAAKFSPPQTMTLDKLELANGQTEEARLEKVKTLETLLGTASTNPYGTTEYAIFEDKIKQMTVADMQGMAQKLGINPFQSSPALAAALKTSFVQNSKQSMGAMREVPKVKNRQLNPRDPKDLAVMQSLGMKIVV